MNDGTVQFGPFELRVSSYELRRDGLPVKLERIPMELLMLLVENPGNLVSRETIMQRLWGNHVFLETEHSINTAMNKLRAVLQDDPKQPVFVQTVVGKGYRFIAKVSLVAPEKSEPIAGPAELVRLNSSRRIQRGLFFHHYQAWRRLIHRMPRSRRSLRAGSLR